MTLLCYLLITSIKPYENHEEKSVKDDIHAIEYRRNLKLDREAHVRTAEYSIRKKEQGLVESWNGEQNLSFLTKQKKVYESFLQTYFLFF